MIAQSPHYTAYMIADQRYGSLYVYQDAGVEDRVGVQGLLGRAECLGEQVGAFAVVPRAVKPADGVVVGYGPTGLYDGIGGGLLYRGLLSRRSRRSCTRPRMCSTAPGRRDRRG